MSLRFFAVVAAYSFDDILTIAALGKYRSPVAFGPWVLGFPDFVRHFCFVQLSKLFCDFAFAILRYPLIFLVIHKTIA